ncbi:MAG: hypothetical protein ACEQSB_01885 [Undibacterium sp.]
MNLRLVGSAIIAVVFIVGAGAYYFFRETPLKNVPLTGSGTVLYFGDSLVEGVGATMGRD